MRRLTRLTRLTLTLATPPLAIIAAKLWPLLDRIAHSMGLCLGS